MNLDKTIKERHSVRRFSSKKPDWRDIIEAIDSANTAPLAGNISALRFILVDDENKISELADASQQDFVGKVSYIVVIVSDTEQLERSYDERGIIYARQQAGASIENFLLKITDLGLASCWVGAFSDEQVRRILGIPDNILVEAILPIGYELGKASQKRKPVLDNILFFNKWKNKFMKEPRKPEAV